MDDLEPATTSASLLPGGVGGDWGDVFNAADLHAWTGESPQGRLCSGSGGLCPVSTGGAELDVKGSDAQGLGLFGDVLSSQHGGIGRRLVTIGLDLHASSHTDNGLSATSKQNNYSIENQSQKLTQEVFITLKVKMLSQTSYNSQPEFTQACENFTPRIRKQSFARALDLIVMEITRSKQSPEYNFFQNILQHALHVSSSTVCFLKRRCSIFLLPRWRKTGQDVRKKRKIAHPSECGWLF